MPACMCACVNVCMFVLFVDMYVAHQVPFNVYLIYTEMACVRQRLKEMLVARGRQNKRQRRRETDTETEKHPHTT